MVFVLICAWKYYIFHTHLNKNKVAIIRDSCKVAQTEFTKLVSFALTVTLLETVRLWSSVFVFIRIVFSLHNFSLRCSGKKQTALCAPSVTESNVDNGLGSSGAFSFLVRPESQPHCHGGSRQSSAPQFLLTACLLRPYSTSRAQVVPKGDYLPVNMQLFHSSIYLSSSCSI